MSWQACGLANGHACSCDKHRLGSAHWETWDGRNIVHVAWDQRGRDTQGTGQSHGDCTERTNEIVRRRAMDARVRQAQSRSGPSWWAAGRKGRPGMQRSGRTQEQVRQKGRFGRHQGHGAAVHRRQHRAVVLQQAEGAMPVLGLDITGLTAGQADAGTTQGSRLLDRADLSKRRRAKSRRCPRRERRHPRGQAEDTQDHPRPSACSG